MKNKYYSATFSQDCKTANIIKVKSNWLAMCTSFAGWIIFFVLSFGVLLLIEAAPKMLLSTIGFFVIVCIVYFPVQWVTDLTVNLEEKTFTIVSPKGKRVVPFSEVTQVVHQGVATIFSANYLWWAEVGGQRIPLVAFSNHPASIDFLMMFERRSKLALFREEGN